MKSLLLYLFVLMTVITPLVFSGEMTLTWDLNPQSENVTEYRIYKMENGKYTYINKSVNNSARINAYIGDSFVITAFNGIESGYSSSVTVPSPSPYNPNYSILSYSSDTREHPSIYSIDGDVMTFWETNYIGTGSGFPHIIIIDLGYPKWIGGWYYTPRQDDQNFGHIGNYEIYISSDKAQWTLIVSSGFSDLTKDSKFLKWEANPKYGRYFKLVVLSELTNTKNITVAEIFPIEVSAPKVRPSKPSKPRLR